MSDTLTSSEALHLSALWRQYDDAATGDRPALRRIIELYVTTATYRRITFDLQAFHKERNK